MPDYEIHLPVFGKKIKRFLEKGVTPEHIFYERSVLGYKTTITLKKEDHLYAVRLYALFNGYKPFLKQFKTRVGPMIITVAAGRPSVILRFIADTLRGETEGGKHPIPEKLIIVLLGEDNDRNRYTRDLLEEILRNAGEEMDFPDLKIYGPLGIGSDRHKKIVHRISADAIDTLINNFADSDEVNKFIDNIIRIAEDKDFCEFIDGKVFVEIAEKEVNENTGVYIKHLMQIGSKNLSEKLAAIIINHWDGIPVGISDIKDFRYDLSTVKENRIFLPYTVLIHRDKDFFTVKSAYFTYSVNKADRNFYFQFHTHDPLCDIINDLNELRSIFITDKVGTFYPLLYYGDPVLRKIHTEKGKSSFEEKVTQSTPSYITTYLATKLDNEDIHSLYIRPEGYNVFIVEEKNIYMGVFKKNTEKLTEASEKLISEIAKKIDRIAEDLEIAERIERPGADIKHIKHIKKEFGKKVNILIKELFPLKYLGRFGINKKAREDKSILSDLQKEIIEILEKTGVCSFTTLYNKYKDIKSNIAAFIRQPGDIFVAWKDLIDRNIITQSEPPNFELTEI